jgi:hypothetical protein
MISKPFDIESDGKGPHIVLRKLSSPQNMFIQGRLRALEAMYET